MRLLVPVRSHTEHRWHGALAKLDAERRESVARYAERIAETLGRALPRLPSGARTDGHAGQPRGLRELGHIAGYVEDIARP